MQAIWIPSAGLQNYRQAENLGIWGMNTKPQEAIGIGSTLLFAWDAGSPRVPADEFAKKLPKNLVVAVATSPLYESAEVLWSSTDGKPAPARPDARHHPGADRRPRVPRCGLGKTPDTGGESPGMIRPTTGSNGRATAPADVAPFLARPVARSNP